MCCCILKMSNFCVVIFADNSTNPGGLYNKPYFSLTPTRRRGYKYVPTWSDPTLTLSGPRGAECRPKSRTGQTGRRTRSRRRSRSVSVLSERAGGHRSSSRLESASTWWQSCLRIQAKKQLIRHENKTLERPGTPSRPRTAGDAVTPLYYGPLQRDTEHDSLIALTSARKSESWQKKKA